MYVNFGSFNLDTILDYQLEFDANLLYACKCRDKKIENMRNMWYLESERTNRAVAKSIGLLNSSCMHA
jgi:hypothetical protein